MARQAILRVSGDDGDKNLMIETDFGSEEIIEAADVIHDNLMDTDDGWNEDKVIEELVAKGYIKILGDGPEVIDLML